MYKLLVVKLKLPSIILVGLNKQSEGIVFRYVVFTVRLSLNLGLSLSYLLSHEEAKLIIGSLRLLDSEKSTDLVFHKPIVSNLPWKRYPHDPLGRKDCKGDSISHYTKSFLDRHASIRCSGRFRPG